MSDKEQGPNISKNNFDVSVIIPVYNAEHYIKTAVESAISLPEVHQILLIEDGSTDSSYEVCLALQKDYSSIDVLTHPNRTNRGVSTSRNLGIRKAQCDYIAFLDADDWYLRHRFIRAKEIFETDPSIDGVYDATGFYYESEQRIDPIRLTRVKPPESHKDLLFTLLQTCGGRFTTNAITIKRKILDKDKAGMFDPGLKLHEDTDLWLRLAFWGKLVPGDLDNPVAIRRVHDRNSIHRISYESRKLFYRKSFRWFNEQDGVDPRVYRILFHRFVASQAQHRIPRILLWIAHFLGRPQDLRKYL